MTSDEANIILTYHLPVVVSKGCNTERLCKGEYRISELSKKYQHHTHSWIYSATLEREQRAVYMVDIFKIEPVDGYRDFIDSKIKEQKKKLFKESVNELVEELKTKKAVYAFIGKLIDEIRQNTG